MFFIVVAAASNFINAQNDTATIIKKIPQKFKFIDFNNDGKISQSEVDFVVNSRLDNVAKNSPTILDEFVSFLEVYKNNPSKTDSIYFNNNAAQSQPLQHNESNAK